jgi:hypothetical protein
MLTTIERKIPDNLNASILSPLIGWDLADMSNGEKMPIKKNRTPELYVEEIQKFEIEAEKRLIKVLSSIGITATVKTDRYSLPYKEEIKISQNGESYLNGPYELERVIRKVTKKLLNDDEYKIRFYVYVEVDTNAGSFLKLGKVNYHFRYYSH